MGLIMTPLFQALFKDWLADLFGAWGSHRPVGFIETHTGIFKFQPTIIQQPTNLVFCVSHNGILKPAHGLQGMAITQLGLAQVRIIFTL